MRSLAGWSAALVLLALLQPGRAFWLLNMLFPPSTTPEAAAANRTPPVVLDGGVSMWWPIKMQNEVKSDLEANFTNRTATTFKQEDEEEEEEEKQELQVGSQRRS